LEGTLAGYLILLLVDSGASHNLITRDLVFNFARYMVALDATVEFQNHQIERDFGRISNFALG